MLLKCVKELSSTWSKTLFVFYIFSGDLLLFRCHQQSRKYTKVCPAVCLEQAASKYINLFSLWMSFPTPFSHAAAEKPIQKGWSVTASSWTKLDNLFLDSLRTTDLLGNISYVCFWLWLLTTFRLRVYCFNGVINEKNNVDDLNIFGKYEIVFFVNDKFYLLICRGNWVGLKSRVV